MHKVARWCWARQSWATWTQFKNHMSFLYLISWMGYHAKKVSTNQVLFTSIYFYLSYIFDWKYGKSSCSLHVQFWRRADRPLYFTKVITVQLKIIPSDFVFSTLWTQMASRANIISHGRNNRRMLWKWFWKRTYSGFSRNR